MKNYIVLSAFALLFQFSYAGVKDTSTYSVVISFFSVSAGIDRDAKEKTDGLIIDFESKYKISVEKNETAWGREGEIDYCIDLRGLTPKERKKFICKVKSIAKKSGRVNILENSPCLHKR